jgi:hypothetical protein
MRLLGMTCALLLTSACGIQPVEMMERPAVPTEALRANLGTIALVTPRSEPYLECRDPVTGAFQGGLLGLGRGIVVTFYLMAMGAGGGGGLASVVGIAAGVAMGAAYTPFSILGGATTAESAAVLTRAHEILFYTLLETRLQERLRGAILETARREAGRELRPLELDPDAAEEPATYARLAGTGVETVLEARVLGISTSSPVGAFTANGEVVVGMSLRTRLIRVVDGCVLHQQDLVVADPLKQHPLAAWTADSGAPLKRQLQSACDYAAERIVEDLFLLVAPARAKP